MVLQHDAQAGAASEDGRSGDALNLAQHGDGNVTQWVTWLSQKFCAACLRSSQIIDQALEKARFWADHSGVELNARQRKVLQRLLDDGDGGLSGGLNAEKYIKMTGTSKPTATRDLTYLVEGSLLWTVGQGKAVRYYVNVPGWTHGVAPQEKQQGRSPERPKG